jgi:hypothetical protein
MMTDELLKLEVQNLYHDVTKIGYEWFENPCSFIIWGRYNGTYMAQVPKNLATPHPKNTIQCSLIL